MKNFVIVKLFISLFFVIKISIKYKTDSESQNKNSLFKEDKKLSSKIKNPKVSEKKIITIKKISINHKENSEFIHRFPSLSLQELNCSQNSNNKITPEFDKQDIKNFIKTKFDTDENQGFLKNYKDIIENKISYKTQNLIINSKI